MISSRLVPSKLAINQALRWCRCMQSGMRTSGRGRARFRAACSGGEGGIRTPGSLQIAGFQDQCFRPLSHLSEAASSISEAAASWEVCFRRRARACLSGVLSFALLAVAANALGADLAEGLGAYAARDYPRAYRELKSLADRGGSVAQTILGTMYLDGDGVTRDYRQALRWFEAAARQGHTGAQFRLAQLYAAGKAVDQNDDFAQQWFAHAAGRGHPDAQYELGHRLEDTDRDGAVTWYRRAADRGHTLARRRLTELAAVAVQPPAFPSAAVAKAAPPSRDQALAAAPVNRRPSAGRSTGAAASGESGSAAYAVQLGAFRRESSAHREQATLIAAHQSLFADIDVWIEAADLGVDKGRWHRVRAGPVDSITAAQALCEQLRRGDGSAGCFAVPVGRP